jgi:DNA-binding SARP family transcriptional activator
MTVRLAGTGVAAAWTASQEQMWVRVIGEFTVARSGRDWSPGEVGTRKARLVLALLAAAGGRLVTVDELVDVLWPDRPPRHPAGNVATLVSRLRAVLGPDAISRCANGYRVGRTIVVDLTAATELVERAEAQLRAASPVAALATARRALDVLGRGDVLPGQPASELAEQARRTHRDLTRQAHHAAAHAALQTGEVHLARATAATAVRFDPLDETAHRALMRANWAAGERAKALAVYERLRRTLAAELGADPSLHSQQLYLDILRERSEVPVHGDLRPTRTSIAPA